MALNRLATYANNNCIYLIKYIREIPEITGFFGTSQASIMWVEKYNKLFPAKKV